VWLLLVAFSLLFIYPFVGLISASFKPRGDVFDKRLIPKSFTFENYLTVWQQAPMAAWLLNTVIVTVLATVTVTLSSAMVAWGFKHHGPTCYDH
jgi:multiple sugar transport system permease protein